MEKITFKIISEQKISQQFIIVFGRINRNLSHSIEYPRKNFWIVSNSSQSPKFVPLFTNPTKSTVFLWNPPKKMVGKWTTNEKSQSQSNNATIRERFYHELNESRQEQHLYYYFLCLARQVLCIWTHIALTQSYRTRVVTSCVTFLHTCSHIMYKFSITI